MDLKKLLVSFFVLVSLSCAAQITLKKDDYNSWKAITETAIRIDTSANKPNIIPGIDQTWDLTTLKFDTNTTYSYYKRTGTYSGFPSATFSDSIKNVINSVLYYKVAMVGTLNNDGAVYFGETLNRQGFGIGLITGGPSDSLIFYGQNIQYSSLNTDLKLPATMGSKWSSSYTYSTDFGLTVQAYALNNAPGKRRTNVVRNDEVVGWGKMKVKNKIGKATNFIPVLLVKTYFVQTDSLFLYGTPAPAPLLSAFGIKQGQHADRFYYQFYRAGELQPLCVSRYKDSTFSTSSVEYYDVHIDRLPFTSSVNNVEKKSNAIVYPNPSSDNSFVIQIGDKSINQLNFNIVDMAGRVVDAGTFDFAAGNASYQNKTNNKGIYFLQLFDGTNLFSTIKLSFN
ncbi:MAG: T9SS type A sorting domain-containing protein [Bacteroidetes bacterium]|nr:T9SS type A sorting domain-containing protein [Bacteroidota bacterium]